MIFISSYFILWSFNIFSILLLPGHSCRLHSSVSVNCPVHEPPLASSTSFVRVFTLEPTPQVEEHSPLTQSFQTQCIAKKRLEGYYIQPTLFLVDTTNMAISKYFTRTIVGVAWLFSLISHRGAYSSVLLFHCFCSRINPDSPSTGNRAIPQLPIIPFAVD